MGGRFLVPGNRLPIGAERHIFGALQLILGGRRLVGRFHHDCAGASQDGAPDAILVDHVFGRGGDQRILQRGARDTGPQSFGHHRLVRGREVWR